MNLCEKYSDLFGNPGEGVHSLRIFNVAVVDVVLTVLGAWLISRVFGGFWCWLVILFLLGIILHRMFCVRTTVDKLLFGD